ncbi:MAG TPA: N(4)-(beta-N-acetylglucosaminyl)-L-asparaginase [Phycisphaerales bacterium]|nr:N(4)-(beta-N-acetylglucosaminyl)-L-asparaginase [Phycisphaerales bacterium]
MATAAGAAALAALGAPAGAQPGAAETPPGASPSAGAAPPARGDAHRGPCLIASANGLAATARAMDLHAGGTLLLDAIVAGIGLVEDDPRDNSVGYGGLPNEEGVVQLDASVMDGALHRAGSVAALERVKNPAAVALQVLRRTDHVLIVGEGALKFARAMGFPEQDLLTPEAREAWLKWKANLGHEDDWLNDDERDEPGRPRRTWRDGLGGHVLPQSPIPWTTGTIHCSGVGEGGQVAACTSTSGLSYKLSGRVGDSPIVGAGMYCDAAVGSAGATGRGEAVIQVCGAFSIVQHMEAGLSPTEACLAVAKRIVDRTREKRLLEAGGRPRFDVKLYAVRRDGAYGAASIYHNARFAVHDGRENRLEDAAWLFEGAPKW